LALVYNLDKLSHMISAGTLLAYGTVCAGVILLRYGDNNDPDRNITRPDSDKITKGQPLQETTSLISEDSKKLLLDREQSYISSCNSYAAFVRNYLWVYLFVYLVSSVMLGVTLQNDWHFSILVCTGTIDFLIFLSIQILRPRDIPKTFKCPLVPLIPLGGLLVNVLLFTALPIGATIRVLVWSVLGTIIYLFYGVRHSKLNKKVLASAVDAQ